MLRWDAFINRNATTGHHISGTCKMGPASDPMAVVDQHGRVHGLEGLRVVDASVMPDCIRANTNVTTMMIGEKIAGYVRSGGVAPSIPLLWKKRRPGVSQTFVGYKPVNAMEPLLWLTSSPKAWRAAEPSLGSKASVVDTNVAPSLSWILM